MLGSAPVRMFACHYCIPALVPPALTPPSAESAGSGLHAGSETTGASSWSHRVGRRSTRDRETRAWRRLACCDIRTACCTPRAAEVARLHHTTRPLVPYDLPFTQTVRLSRCTTR
jgi:hypothetical protein